MTRGHTTASIRTIHERIIKPHGTDFDAHTRTTKGTAVATGSRI
jgi:hypothetical protein